MARVDFILVLIAASGVASCSDPPDRIGARSPRELRVPAVVAANNIVVPGCCSLNSHGLAFERATSDSYVLEGARPGLRMNLVFGPFEARSSGASTGTRTIDGVAVREEAQRQGGSVKHVWTASVLPSEQGARAGLRPYGLRIEADCSGNESCALAQGIVGSLRF